MSDVEGTRPRARRSAPTSGSPAPRSARGARGGRLAPLYARAERLPWWVLLAVAVGVSALLPFVSSSEYVIRVARQHAPLRAARARAERRRRLGRPARPRLRRLLRLRRLRLRAALVVDSSTSTCPALLSVSIVIVSSALLGLLLGLPSRRLVGDYLAIVTLFFAQIFVVLATNARPDHVPVERRPDRHLRRPERDHRHRPDQHLRLRVRLDPQLPLALARRLRRGGRGAAVHQPLAHRAGLAGAARGLARRRDDEHAGEPAEAARVHVRRRDGRPDRDDLRRRPARRLPAELRPAAADHGLRDGHPRRRRQHRRASSSARSRSTSRSSCSATPTNARSSSTWRSGSASSRSCGRGGGSPRSSSAWSCSGSSPTSWPSGCGPPGCPARSRAAASPACSTAG